ncbi:MAG: XcyI family restriction endonuclease [Proteobacteria bacterium]|nr:XcyI family restriction endonuclease [Pseudomonadota bacterium]
MLEEPKTQIAFANLLTEKRSLYLQDSLKKTISSIDIEIVDKELVKFVPKICLSKMASQGMRGELMFPAPIILKSNPYLLGYYRLLYGYSQKEFYNTKTGLSRFKTMEKTGALSSQCEKLLAQLCKVLITSGRLLLENLVEEDLDSEFLDDLTLLTLGPQLRGGQNVKKGEEGIKAVFDAIKKIVKPQIINSTDRKITLINAAKRTVHIEFAPDPDIIFKEEFNSGEFRKLIAIEVKGGSDFSNIHNRIGEAEKSHQKAKAEGFIECWTIVNVDKIDLNKAHKESPATNKFYKISDILSGSGDEYISFRNNIVQLAGIKDF